MVRFQMSEVWLGLKLSDLNNPSPLLIKQKENKKPFQQKTSWYSLRGFLFSLYCELNNLSIFTSIRERNPIKW